MCNHHALLLVQEFPLVHDVSFSKKRKKVLKTWIVWSLKTTSAECQENEAVRTAGTDMETVSKWMCVCTCVRRKESDKETESFSVANKVRAVLRLLCSISIWRQFKDWLLVPLWKMWLTIVLFQESEWLESGSHFVETVLGVGPHLDSLFTRADLHYGIAD